MKEESQISILRVFIKEIADEERTPQRIRDELASRSKLLNFQLDEDTLERIAKIFEVQFNVALDVGYTVKKNNSKPWWKDFVEGGAQTHYSTRFQTFIKEDEKMQLPLQVVSKTDEITDEIIDLVGDPRVEGTWKRRGMVIGHVQSGKTLNYSSLITKAADAGYRVILLLAGITNSLRKQTQDRIDHAFIGQQSTEANVQTTINIGAARHTTETPIRHPNYLTSLEKDFSLLSALATRGIQLGSSTEPVIFVCKKNVSTLRNIYKFFENTRAQGVLSHPFIMIDDEADNASINTLLSQNKVTAINQKLRQILSLFERSSYVGYTATPFANIFIDPDSVDDMGNDDLFPSDYIKTLDAPTNYIGPNEVFGKDAPLKNTMVLTPDDYSNLLKPNHKSDLVLEDLPDSLKDAVLIFILAKAVRIYRKQHKKHCSMMVNISRFNNVQRQAYDFIEQYLSEIRDDINSNSKKTKYPEESKLYKLKDIYEQEFLGKTNEENRNEYPAWNDLDLFKAVRFMKVKLVNMTAGQLDYESEKDGLTVIAIGGLALSRGLTLEGLTVSYILRNASAYDTLMQMGRWFGYRDGYRDLCRLFIQSSSLKHYEQTTRAIAELREELAQMQDLGKTPMQFGLKVKSHPQSLAITALNKMRTAQRITHFEGLGGESEEVFAVYHDNNKNKHNRNLTRNFIDSLGQTDDEGGTTKKPKFFWSNVPKETVLAFVEKFQLPSICRKFEYVNDVGGSVFSKFVNSGGEKLSSWHVAIANDFEGAVEDENTLLPNVKLKKLSRKSGELKEMSSDGMVFYFTKSRNMATPVHASFGLEETDIKFLVDNPEFNQDGNPKQISAKRYNTKRRKPLLLIYELHCKEAENNSEIFSQPAVAFVAHFPDGDFSTIRVEYAINKVAQQLELFNNQNEPLDDELTDGDNDEAREFEMLQEDN